MKLFIPFLVVLKHQLKESLYLASSPVSLFLLQAAIRGDCEPDHSCQGQVEILKRISEAGFRNQKTWLDPALSSRKSVYFLLVFQHR